MITVIAGQNWGSGKLSDSLEFTWLENARTPELALLINHKDPRIFKLQHTIHPPLHTLSHENAPEELISIPYNQRCHPSNVKAHNASLEA